MPAALRVISAAVETTPVSDELLGSLYHSQGQGIAEVVAAYPALQRARVAMFCYGRAHLREIGLAVAATCDEASLISVGGKAGEVLFALSRERPEELKSVVSGRRKITLASAASQSELRPFDQDAPDDEIGAEEAEASVQESVAEDQFTAEDEFAAEDEQVGCEDPGPLPCVGEQAQVFAEHAFPQLAAG